MNDEGRAWSMNAACWREVALRGGLSVSDVMALRTVCRRFTFVFAATNNNPLWFSLFRNSCALYPALHSALSGAFDATDCADSYATQTSRLIQKTCLRTRTTSCRLSMSFQVRQSVTQEPRT